MAYKSTDDLDRRIELLSRPSGGTSWGAILADGLKGWKSGKLSKEKAALEEANEKNRARELSMLLKGAETGMVGGPGQGMGALRTAPFSQFNPTDPEVQKLAAELRLNRAQKGTEMTDDMQEFQYAQTNPKFTEWMDRNQQEGGVNSQLLQVLRGDGTVGYVQRDPRSNQFTDMEGRPWSPSGNDRLTNIGSPQGAMADVLPPNRDADLKASEGAVKSFNSVAARITDLVKQNPDINTMVATGSGFIAGLAQEAAALGTALGVPKEVFDPASYQAAFRELGIEDAAMQSLVTSLAYQAAQASGQSGRSASNADVQRFIRQIGANRSDPQAFMRAIEETAKTVNDQYRFTYESMHGKPFEGDLGMPQFQRSSAVTTPSGNSFIIEEVP
jgi:hypothetical protein